MDGILEYVQGDAFRPEISMSIDEVLRPLLEGVQFKSLKGNDGNLYPGMNPF